MPNPPTIEQLKNAIRTLVLVRGNEAGAEAFEAALEALAQGAFEAGYAHYEANGPSDV